MSDVTVKVGLSGAGFKTGLDRLKGDLKGFKKEQESAFAGLGRSLAGALTVGAAISFGKSMIDLGSNIADTADEIQLSTDAFQELTYAFGQNGVSSEMATKGLRKLAENIEDARNGSEKMIASFAKVGVTWEDLHRLSPEEILEKTANGLQAITDPAEGVAISLDLMGKAGARMAVTLRQGADELARLRAEATKISSDDVKALDSAGDKIDRWKNKLMAGAARVLLHPGEALDAITGKTIKTPWANGEDLAAARQRAAAGPGTAAPGAVPEMPAAKKAREAEEKARNAANFQAQEDEKAFRAELQKTSDEFDAEKKKAGEKAADDAKKLAESVSKSKALLAEQDAARDAKMQEKKAKSDHEAAEKTKAAIERQALPADERRQLKRDEDRQKRREAQAERIIKGRAADKERNRIANRKELDHAFPKPADGDAAVATNIATMTTALAELKASIENKLTVA